MIAGLVAEVVMTFMFLIVILGTTHRRAPVGFAGVAIGLALTLIHLISIPVTNTSVNPARSTATALFVGGWALQQLWLFWVAPIVGAALAGFMHKAARRLSRTAGDRTQRPVARPALRTNQDPNRSDRHARQRAIRSIQTSTTKSSPNRRRYSPLADARNWSRLTRRTTNRRRRRRHRRRLCFRHHRLHRQNTPRLHRLHQ